MSANPKDTKGGHKTHDAPAAQPAQPAQPAPAAQPPPPAAGAVKLLKKISLRSVCGDIERPTKETAMFRVLGVIFGVKRGNSQFGDFLGFTGNFEATNIATGQRYRGGTCYLPSVVQDMLHSSLADVQANDAGASVQFAIEVGITPSTKAAVGYEYTVRPLVALAPSEALAALSNQVAAIGYDPHG